RLDRGLLGAEPSRGHRLPGRIDREASGVRREATAGRHPRRVAAALCSAALLATLALPAGAQLFGGDDTARKRIAEETKRIDALLQQNEAMQARIEKLESSLNALSGSNPAIQLAEQIERLRQEVQQLRGQVEVLAHETQGEA